MSSLVSLFYLREDLCKVEQLAGGFISRGYLAMLAILLKKVYDLRNEYLVYVTGKQSKGAAPYVRTS